MRRGIGRGYLSATLFVACSQTAVAQTASIESARARQYFEQAQRICQNDSGKLWGKSLCGPMLFADPTTHAIAGNQAGRESRLKPQDGVFIGTLPAEINVANTAVEWAGVRWTMVMWPLPASPTASARLLMHESFHRIQQELGLPAMSPANAHLGTFEGRVWLRLEWRALRQALARPDGQPADRRQAVQDALLFRAQRHALFSKAAEEERELELNEGLAEYTGYKLRGTPETATIEAVIERLGSAESETAFSRSFAYASGPAYGLLLDLSGVSWKRQLNAKSDLGEQLRQAYALPAASLGLASQRAAAYDGGALRWLETQQEEQRSRTAEGYRKRLITGPVLTLPVTEEFNFSFDPNAVIPLDDLTSAYSTLRVADVWGVLEVTDGALLARNHDRFVRVAVEAPPAGSGKMGEVTGNGWKLSLKPGWVLANDERAGDLRVVKQP